LLFDLTHARTQIETHDDGKLDRFLFRWVRDGDGIVVDDDDVDEVLK